MTNGANASYVNLDFAADVLYMRVNSHVICEINLYILTYINYICIYVRRVRSAGNKYVDNKSRQYETARNINIFN